MFSLLVKIFSYINNTIKQTKRVWGLGVLNSIVSISTTISFFIPIKIILSLENPSSLDRFAIKGFSSEKLIYFIAILFIMSIFISIVGKLFVNKRALKQRERLWQNYKQVVKKATFIKVHKSAMELYSSTILITAVFIVVLYLEYILAIFLLTSFFGFIIFANKVIKVKNYDYSTFFRILSDSGFYATFFLILGLYFGGLKIVALEILFAFMLSRLYFRNLNQFSTQLIKLHKEMNKK